MRLAFYVTMHQKPYQFEWLAKALESGKHLILLQVDLKSRLGLKRERSGIYRSAKAFAAGRPNVHLLPSRITNWGGWSLSQAFLEAIDTALALDAEWSYFINLSGQCYPLRPLDEIAAALAANAGAEYVELRPLSSLPADDWHLKWMPMVETPFRAVRLPGRRRPPKTFTLGWKGSQWVMLTRAFCEWQQHSRLRTDVSSYLSHSLLSDEVLTQSLLMNSPFSQNVSASYARDIVWPGPKVLDMDDWPRLSTSRAHFARKFDAKIDREVLLSLARKSGFPEGLIAG